MASFWFPSCKLSQSAVEVTQPVTGSLGSLPNAPFVLLALHWVSHLLIRT